MRLQTISTHVLPDPFLLFFVVVVRAVAERRKGRADARERGWTFITKTFRTISVPQPVAAAAAGAEEEEDVEPEEEEGERLPTTVPFPSPILNPFKSHDTPFPSGTFEASTA